MITGLTFAFSFVAVSIIRAFGIICTAVFAVMLCIGTDSSGDHRVAISAGIHAFSIPAGFGRFALGGAVAAVRCIALNAEAAAFAPGLIGRTGRIFPAFSLNAL
jgi:hypothetical protein